MIRDDKFVLSRKPYAVDSGSLTTSQVENGSRVRGTVRALWFRQSSRVSHRRIRVSLGLLWEYQDPPIDLESFMDRLDGYRGVSALARWDGRTLWAPDATEEMRTGYLQVLRPALAAYPEVPEGYSGWWHSPRN